MDRECEMPMRRYATIEAFGAGFGLPDAVPAEFVRTGFAAAKPLAHIQLTVLIAPQLFGTEGLCRVMNRRRGDAGSEALRVTGDEDEAGRRRLEAEK